MKDSNGNGSGNDHEVIRLKDVARYGDHGIFRLDKIIEKAMLNPIPEVEIDFLYAKKYEVATIIGQCRVDLEYLKASKNELPSGEIDPKIKLLQKRIDQYEAVRVVISKMINEVRRKVIIDARGGGRQLKSERLVQIERRLDDNDQKMLEIAGRLNLTNEVIDSFASTKKPSLKKRIINALKEFAGWFASPIPAKEEEGSDSITKTPTCPHCGGRCNEMFCENTGKPLSQDNAT